MASGRSAGALGAAGKWFTALLTTTAAVVALLVNAQSLGLTSWLGATDFSFAGYAVRRILVTPRADSLLAIGDTAILAATVTDRRGGVLIGVPLLWTSEDTTIAVVDSAGAVAARGPGVTRVTVQVREHRASATIVVRPQVARIAMGPDSTISLPEMDSTRISAIAFDARGVRVRGAALTWTSSDTFAVTVDSLGRVRTRAPGRAQVVASAGGRQGSVNVDVRLTPFRLRVVDGNEQHAPVGRPLPDPVTVEVLSRGGQPVPGVEVLLSATHGSTESERLRTDVRGRVQPGWTLGGRPGRQQLKGRIAGVDSTVTIVAEADPTAAGTRIELADSALTGVVGTTLNPPVILRLTDPDGVPLTDVPVSWTAGDGGSVIPLAPRTDSLGQVVARWTLGKKAGKQRLRAQVGDARTMPAYPVTTVARPGMPATITVVSGGSQRVSAGRPAQPIVLELRDSLGNLVPDVKLTVTASTGALAESPASDARGRVALKWTAGAGAGVAAISAELPGSRARAEVQVKVSVPEVKKAPAKKRVAKPPPAKKPR